MMRKTFIFAAVAVAALAQTAGADSPSTTTDDLARLRNRDSELAWAARTTKGAPRQSIELERRRLDQLIEDLEAGRTVDPATIDRAIGVHQ